MLTHHKECRGRVLVVDDNHISAESLATLLADADYEVQTAFNGDDALVMVRQFDPDICILDINMPGMSGYQLALHIRGISSAHQPILATMTACADANHLDRAARAGFDLHFAKPADVDDMIAQIENCRKQ